MRPYLLDTNVLIALAWPAHVHHGTCQNWFKRESRAGFRTCPLTEAAFVRISSSPSFSKNAVTPAEAGELLRQITSLPEHGFWAADIGLLEALNGCRGLVGHRQVTDAYLLALARSHRGILATLDRGIAVLTADPACLRIITGEEEVRTV